MCKSYRHIQIIKYMLKFGKVTLAIVTLLISSGHCNHLCRRKLCCFVLSFNLVCVFIFVLFCLFVCLCFFLYFVYVLDIFSLTCELSQRVNIKQIQQHMKYKQRKRKTFWLMTLFKLDSHCNIVKFAPTIFGTKPPQNLILIPFNNYITL